MPLPVLDAAFEVLDRCNVLRAALFLVDFVGDPLRCRYARFEFLQVGVFLFAIEDFYQALRPVSAKTRARITRADLTNLQQKRILANALNGFDEERRQLRLYVEDVV